MPAHSFTSASQADYDSLPSIGDLVEQDSLEYVFPPLALLIQAGSLEMRLLREADMPVYAALLRQPIFDEGVEFASFPWYTPDPDERVRQAFQFQWRQRAQFRADEWELPFGVFWQGSLVGMQSVLSKNFAITRRVETGSWLTRDFHRQGIGTLMRTAMLVFAFQHLGAARAESSAVRGNLPSLGVSRKAGYAWNGTEVAVIDGERVELQRVVVTPDSAVVPHTPVRVSGMTRELMELLGAAAPASAD